MGENSGKGFVNRVTQGRFDESLQTSSVRNRYVAVISPCSSCANFVRNRSPLNGWHRDCETVMNRPHPHTRSLSCRAVTSRNIRTSRSGRPSTSRRVTSYAAVSEKEAMAESVGHSQQGIRWRKQVRERARRTRHQCLQPEGWQEGRGGVGGAIGRAAFGGRAESGGYPQKKCERRVARFSMPRSLRPQSYLISCCNFFALSR